MNAPLKFRDQANKQPPNAIVGEDLTTLGVGLFADNQWIVQYSMIMEEF